MLHPVIEKQPERPAEIDDGSGKRNLVGTTRADLAREFESIGLKRMHAQQVWQWMYKRGATDFADMTNIAKTTRELLAEHYVIGRAGIAKSLISFDETRKWLITYHDKNEVETVYIPEEDRGTLCISSQVGCTLSCTFCHTGTQRLVRNLTAGDIITQMLIAKDGLNDWLPLETRDKSVVSPNAEKRNAAIPSLAPSNAHRAVTNIVFMGMGEPLMNYDHVVRAIDILSDNEGLALSRRKITVSTSGVVPLIEKLGHDAGCSLAISLHAVTDELRDVIVPINRKYPIEQLLNACRNYPELSNAKRIMFEYVMLKGVNDSDADARQLVRLLKDIPSKVNLIPFNPWPGAPYECSSNNRIHAFRRILQEAGITTPIRKTRGEDIMAACGQLKSASELQKGQKVKLK